MPPTAVLLLGLLSVTDDPKGDAAKQELSRHRGTWQVTSLVREGRESSPEINRSIVREVDGDHVVWKRDGQSFAGTTISLDPKADPPAIDVIPDGGPSRGERVLGIYKLDGDALTICMASPGGPRPRTFAAAEGSGNTLTTFRRRGKSSAERRP